MRGLSWVNRRASVITDMGTKAMGPLTFHCPPVCPLSSLLSLPDEAAGSVTSMTTFDISSYLLHRWSSA